MSVLSGALGSLIGYLGAEVAESAIFERLLWPQRFYFNVNPKIFLIQVFLLPMGGPLHRVALQTLDTFCKHGLYLGRQRGNMLGTTFFADLQMKYFVRTIEAEHTLAKDVRNGFWLVVLQNLRTKTPVAAAMRLRYAAQPVHHLRLRPAVADQATSGSTSISESSVSWRSFAGIFSSELSAIAVAIAISVHRQSIWVAFYLCIPLLFKLLAILFSVRRTPITKNDTPDAPPEIFEIDDLQHGFAVIEGPPAIVQQFFRHYGHPIRDNPLARPREVASFIIVYLFMLYFPAGLLSLLWMDPVVQYYWLGYQVYTVLAMHITRLAGLGGCGRTEIRVAELLSDGKKVKLESHGGGAVLATVSTKEVESVANGKQVVLDIIQEHQQKLHAADTPIEERR